MTTQLKTRLTVDTLEARDVPTTIPLNWFQSDPSPQPSRALPTLIDCVPERVGYQPVPIEIQPFRPQLPLPLPKPGTPDPLVVRVTLAEGKTVSPVVVAKLKAAANPAPTPAFVTRADFVG